MLVFTIEFDLVGKGWCRPDGCKVMDKACRLKGYFKDEYNSFDCKNVCSNNPYCTGYAISDERHGYPNRCFIYGDIYSTKDELTGWQIIWPESGKFPGSVPSKVKTRGDDFVECFKRFEALNSSMIIQFEMKFVRVSSFMLFFVVLIFYLYDFLFDQLNLVDAEVLKLLKNFNTGGKS